MAEKRYCIICGNEVHSNDPDESFCPEHGGSSNTKTSATQLQETTWETEENAVQPLTDITGGWQKGKILLDTYKVVGKLGEGGMGVVYLVHHKSWNMDLAVKQPKTSLFATQKGKEGFIREAETWVDLGLHPHITSCYYVRTIDDIPHIFVEYLAGGSLEDWIQRKEHDLYAGGPERGLERILDIAIQFAWGLAYAHEQGLVHQDVKPLNVLMTPDGIVKVTDFGLAKARAKAGESAGLKDDRALVSGSLHTVAYRSPEQAKGEMLSHKTDIWSWAVSVLEMFEGGVYWYDGQSAETSLESYLGGHGDDQLSDMPVSLIEILRECFQKDPEARPDDMLEIANKLTEIFECKIGEPYPRQKPDPAELKADSMNNKALTMLDLGKPEKAEALLEQAVAADSQNVDATYNLGLLRWRSARVTDVDVLQRLEQIQQDQPEDSGVASALGWVCLESGRFGEALAYFEQTARLGSDSDSEHGLALARPLAVTGMGACLRTFEGRAHWVNSVAISPDGRKILSGSLDRTLKLWDLATGECQHTFKGHTKSVNSVAISPDGRQALSGSGDKTLKLWDLAKGECLCTFEGHKDKVNAVAISPDGRNALSGSSDKTIKLWDLDSGECLRTFEERAHWVSSVAISQDGRKILSGSLDRTLKLWDIATGECLRTFNGHTTVVNSVAISPDGRQGLSGSRDHTLKLWDLATGECLRTFVGHNEHWVNSVAISPDGRQALSGSSDNMLKLWDLATGRCLRTFEGYKGIVEAVAFSPDGRQALSGNRLQTLKLWDLAWLEEAHYAAPLCYARGVAGSEAARRERANAAHLQQAHKVFDKGQIAEALVCLEQARGVPGFERAFETLALYNKVGTCARITGFKGGWLTHTFEGHTKEVGSVAISQDGRQALSGSWDKTLKLWDLVNGECLRTFEGHEENVSSVAISPDGHYALSGSFDKTLKLWDLAMGECLRTFKGHEGYVNAVAIIPGGRQALSGSGDSTLKLWDLAKGECLRTFEGHEESVQSVAISPDGCEILSGSGSVRCDDIKLWDLASGRCMRTFAISDDEHQALSGSKDRTLKLWDTAKGQCLRTFKGFIIWGIYPVAISPNGRKILSGGFGRTLKLWDMATGRCLRTFAGHTHRVTAVAISPNGCQVLSGSIDHTLKLWDLDWEYAFPGWSDWDEGARLYLESFLTLHTSFAGQLSRDREPTDEGIRRGLMHSGIPNWTEADFQNLLVELGHRGYGWLREEGVRKKLEEMAAERG